MSWEPIDYETASITEWTSADRQRHLASSKAYWSHFDSEVHSNHAGLILDDALNLWEMAEEQVKDLEDENAKLRMMGRPIGGRDAVAMFGNRWRAESDFLGRTAIEYIKEAEDSWKRAEWEKIEAQRKILAGQQIAIMILVLFLLTTIFQGCD